MIQIERVGLDIGFGHDKAAIIRDGKLTEVSFPSVLGHAQNLSRYTTGLGRSTRRRATRLVYDGVEYYIGDDALRHSRTQAGRQDRNRIGSVEERVLALAALARLNVEHAYVVTGLPVLWFDDRKKLSRNLFGEHKFTWGRQERCVTIHKVVVLPQPFGGFYSHVLGENGQAVIPNEEITRTFACIDVGWNTTDMTVIRNLEPVDQWTGGARVGVRDLIQMVDDEIKRVYGLDLHPHEVEQAIRDGRVEVYGEFHDITDISNSATSLLSQQIISNGTDLWGNGERMSSILILGGGGGYFGSDIRATFPRNSVLLPRPGMANARGFCFFAQRNIWPTKNR
jgi:plasmid segregation protein ParM